MRDLLSKQGLDWGELDIVGVVAAAAAVERTEQMRILHHDLVWLIRSLACECDSGCSKCS